ncbi:MurG-like transferase [Caulifigura coniformis]|uniref:MurG-like transferase n=1 Tax=Caulifigura coniformis TaxID=2527983 RepID=A0A517S8I4_9PLAN|nr:nucleotide disphospho-sugar-binding domain-containing protein [Caulifigura coniformis]QDT52444.1 MurG-like transferase [Caulifigura coniformis]
MHFVVSPLGSAGDVFPFLGLSLELKDRGHDITFATNAHFEELIVRHGLKFVALGREDDYQATIRNPDLWSPRKAFPHIMRSLRPILRTQYDICAAAGRDSVSLVNVFGFGALLAQEKLGIRAVTVHLQPSVLWSNVDPPTLPGLGGPRWFKSFLYGLGEKLVIDPAVCPFLNSWRAELGLPPVRRITRWWNSPGGVLCMFPDWFAPVQPDWPAGVVQSDFPLWNEGSARPLAEGLVRFLDAGPPPIVFTPGTANIHGRPFFEAAVDACGRIGRRAVFLTQHPEQVPDNLPGSIHFERYAPLDRLLPNAAAFVHHGGIGSSSQGFLAGIPQLLMPLAHDQFDNAERIRRLGTGLGVPAAKFNARTLQAGLQRVLESVDVAAACRGIASRLERRDGLPRSADILLDQVLGA